MIKIKGVTKRNLQEQVGYNSEQIDKIFEILDGINVQDNLIKLTASSGTLTAEAMAVVEKDVAFIIYNNNLYIKATTSASEYTFKQIALSASDQGTYNILQSFRIVVTRANGAYLYSSNTVLSLYDKTKMDSLLGAKADQSAVTSALAGKADLAGANFTGNITGPSIIENMSGYSFTKEVVPNVNSSLNYAGVVKNGNKITFAVAGIMTRTGTIEVNNDIGYFTIPASIAEKLFPNVSSWLDAKKLYFVKDYSSGVDIPLLFIKESNTKLRIRLFNSNALMDLNQDYSYRYECTFLLSDNLAL